MDERKITGGEVFGYSFYMFAAMFGMLTFAYMNMFYPGIGMPMALFSTALLIARIIDFVITLFVGAIIEKFTPKIGSGKYRPWLVIGEFLIYGGMVLLFIDFGSNAARFVVVIVGSLLVNTTMSFLSVAMFGIMPLIAGASQDNRNKLAAWSYRASTLGQVGTSLTGAFLITFFQQKIAKSTNPVMTDFSDPKNVLGVTIATVVLGLFYFVGIELLRKTAKPYDVVADAAEGGYKPPPVTLKDMATAVATNGQLLIFLSAQTLVWTGLMAMMGIAMYYYQFVVYKVTGSPGFPGVYTVAMSITTFASFGFAMIGPAIGKRLGKKNAMVVGLLSALVSSVLILLFGVRSWILYVCFGFLGTLGSALWAGFGINYALDCGEYGFWKTGKDNRVVIMSMTNMPMKIATILGGLVLYVLPLIGFDAFAMQSDINNVTDAFISKYMLLLGGIPAVCYAIAAAIMMFGYKITDADAAKYAKENMDRMMAAGGPGGPGGPPPAPEE